MSALASMIVEFNLIDHSYKQIQLDDLEVDFHKKNKIYWVHVDLNQQDVFKKISEKLQFPDHVIDLCKLKDTRFTLLDTSESLTIRIQSVQSTELQLKKEIIYESLVIHLTPYYCLTFAKSPLPALTSFVEGYSKALKYARTPCFILFVILDNVINNYSDILYEYELIVDKIDLRIRKTSKNIYNDVMHTKKKVMKAERHAATVRDILMRISGRKIMVISEQCRISLCNLFDHSQMIVGEAIAIREILNGILDQIDNTLMHKMSESMQLLTAFAAIFLPLTLIAGIYGMNFRWMPELEWKYGYFSALGLMLICGCSLYFIFKKKEWF
ncbi:MAG: magnesium transporter [Gammaproteobacteria bacterium]|nr:magnesium transporter [Gammaproteobacteria bacterium]